MRKWLRARSTPLIFCLPLLVGCAKSTPEKEAIASLFKPPSTPLSDQLFSHETLAYFIPPKGWEIAAPMTLAPHVKMAFFKKCSTDFSPSVNLAVEKTEVSLEEYLQAIKEIHTRERKSQWRSLGKLETHAGTAHLTEIETLTEYGKVRVIQAIYLEAGYAYILSAAALKDQFSDYLMEFEKAFSTLTLTHNLLAQIPDHERQDALKYSFHHLQNLCNASEDRVISFQNEEFQKQFWLPFQKKVITDFADMGPFWQTLLLKTYQQKLQS